MSIETSKALDAQIQENKEKWEKAVKRADTFGNVCNASTATMIVGFTITGGPIAFLTTVTGAAIGYGISHLISEGDRQNDNKIGWGIAKIFGATPENSPAANSSTLPFI